jgi:2-phospho-L-lactate guanylyltransferase
MVGAVLIPVKAFARAKARLAPVLSAAERHSLARSLATAVVTAIKNHDEQLGIHIACDDDEVAQWAETSGVNILWGPGLGLNGAIDAGIASLAANGVERVAVTHADLTRPEQIGDLLGLHLGLDLGLDLDDGPPTSSAEHHRASSVVLVPDRHRDGTNIIIQPTRSPLPASYGPGSFRRHLDLAMERTRSMSSGITVRYDPLLGLDIDTVEDLSHPLAARWRRAIAALDSEFEPTTPETSELSI